MAPTPSGSNRFHLAARITLVLTFVVIIAGSVVRSTGAGMGCPDWPKCFGHYVPPTHISELQYEEGRAFKAGHFIIHDNALWKAKRDLVATGAIDMGDWEKYTKHDYAVFNAAHTWTEYVNRLSGVLLGFAAIWMVVTAFGRRREDRMALVMATAAFALIAFEGWLGALVVESNLAPVKITTHMVVALIIVAVMVWVVRRARGVESAGMPALSRGTVGLIVASLVLTMAQTVLGTQVREELDLIADAMGEMRRADWADALGTLFYIHRTFAWALLAANAVLILRMLREARGFARTQRKAAYLAGLLLVAIGSGIALQEAMPAAAQPTHLLVAALMFGLQFSLFLDTRRRRDTASHDTLAASRRSPVEQPV